MNKKVLIGIGIGIILLCIVSSVILLLITGGGLMVQQSLKDPENVNIVVDVPVQASKGETVTLDIRVENTATDAQLLHSVDIDSSYLAGVVIDEAVPPFSESAPIPVVDMQTYTFEKQIPAGETLVVQLNGTAVETGDYSGRVDICINTGSLCKTFTTRTVVHE